MSIRLLLGLSECNENTIQEAAGKSPAILGVRSYADSFGRQARYTVGHGRLFRTAGLRTLDRRRGRYRQMDLGSRGGRCASFPTADAVHHRRFPQPDVLASTADGGGSLAA